jgi:hypothetical protein
VTEDPPSAILSSERAAPDPVPARRRGLHLGPIPLTPINILVTLALIGSVVFILWVVLNRDVDQIRLLAAGFAVLGSTLVVIAILSLVAMWRAASRARVGRAFLLAIFGGLAALGAIGCFTVTALMAMLWST